MSDPASYLTLFTTALLAATVLPAQSELVLVGLLLAGGQPPGLLILVATTGNVLGAAANWALGRALDRLHDRPWFPVKPSTLERAQRFYHRYGRWSLLLSWMPIIGDPLTVIAGVLREPFHSVLAIVTLAKLGRYLVLAALTVG